MKSEISSPWTFLFKFIFPLPFALVSINLIASAWFGKVPLAYGDISLPEMRYVSIIFSAFLLGVPIGFGGRLK